MRKLPIYQLAEQLGQELKKRHLKLTTAESCTGGGLAYWLTSISGSSKWFERGFITYSNEAKIELLTVKKETLQIFGAVSAETVREMASGALQQSHADISIAITGIAGPEGGSTEKPVGTVWIAWATNNTIEVMENIFSGDRQSIREQSITEAIEKLMEWLKIFHRPSS